MTTATATADPKPAAAEQNGHLTKDDEYRRNISTKLSDAYRALGKSHLRLERCKSEQKEAKGGVEAAQQEVNNLVSEIRDLELGQYQPELFDDDDDGKAATKAAPAALVDEGAALPIDTLVEFSMTQAKIDLLKESKFEVKTVGDLERAIRENAHWYRDIHGMGQKAIDKLMDVLLEFRKTYPVPAVLSDDKEVSLVIDGGATLKMPAAEAVKTILEDATAKLGKK